MKEIKRFFIAAGEETATAIAYGLALAAEADPLIFTVDLMVWLYEDMAIGAYKKVNYDCYTVPEDPNEPSWPRTIEDEDLPERCTRAKLSKEEYWKRYALLSEEEQLYTASLEKSGWIFQMKEASGEGYFIHKDRLLAPPPPAYIGQGETLKDVDPSGAPVEMPEVLRKDCQRTKKLLIIIENNRKSIKRKPIKKLRICIS